jgi:hypothetical protein
MDDPDHQAEKWSPTSGTARIDQLAATGFSDLPIAIESGTELKSHRVPRSLFAGDFAGLKGCIYHIGNPDLKTRRTGRIFFAYDLLSDQARSASRFLEFSPDFSPAIHQLLESLIESSPVRRLLFTSDWQFGPRRTYRSPIMTLDEFWSLHSSRKLRLNTAYPIHH